MALAAFTGMRRGEILDLCWKDVDLVNQRVYLTETKNGMLRVVALNVLAVQVLKSLPRGEPGTLVFPDVNAARLSVYTRRVFASVRIEAEISTADQELQLLDSNRETMESFVRFAELILLDIAHAWGIAGPEQRQRIQNLLFGDGLAYSEESGFLNRSKSSLFSMLRGIQNENILLASPMGFEPMLSP